MTSPDAWAITQIAAIIKIVVPLAAAAQAERRRLEGLDPNSEATLSAARYADERRSHAAD